MLAFQKAAKLIKKQGWIQNQNRGPKGERCILTAIEDSLEKEESLHDYIDVLGHELGFRPHHWNDAPTRTKEEVVALLYQMHHAHRV